MGCRGQFRSGSQGELLRGGDISTEKRAKQMFWRRTFLAEGTAAHLMVCWGPVQVFPFFNLSLFFPT